MIEQLQHIVSLSRVPYDWFSRGELARSLCTYFDVRSATKNETTRGSRRRMTQNRNEHEFIKDVVAGVAFVPQEREYHTRSYYIKKTNKTLKQGCSKNS